MAATLLLVYAGATVLTLGFWVWQTGIFEPAPRILVRVAAALAAALGLYRRQRWAWWLGLLVATWLVAGAIRAIAVGQLSGLAARRPYPLLDYLQFAVSFGSVAAALALLVAPSSRAALHATSSAPGSSGER
ncbi:MAG TPA: hypothetical protein VH158_09675 [Gemmatimonadales bacterium]|nr:hypothetical protein [Gemmatimonadales bacterium]